jgi:hypothetical protein
MFTTNATQYHPRDPYRIRDVSQWIQYLDVANLLRTVYLFIYSIVIRDTSLVEPSPHIKSK